MNQMTYTDVVLTWAVANVLFLVVLLGQLAITEIRCWRVRRELTAVERARDEELRQWRATW